MLHHHDIPLSINTFDAVSQYTSLNSSASLSIVVLGRCGVLSFTPPWKISPFQNGVVCMCPRLNRVSITTDIPADEAHDEDLWLGECDARRGFCPATFEVHSRRNRRPFYIPIVTGSRRFYHRETLCAVHILAIEGDVALDIRIRRALMQGKNWMANVLRFWISL